MNGRGSGAEAGVIDRHHTERIISRGGVGPLQSKGRAGRRLFCAQNTSPGVKGHICYRTNCVQDLDRNVDFGQICIEDASLFLQRRPLFKRLFADQL